jgi:WD40 repeat protein
MVFLVPALLAAADPLPESARARCGSNRMRHGGPVTQVALSPDGKTIASAGGDRVIRFWEARTGQALAATEPLATTPSQLRFSPDGKRLAAMAVASEVTVWDVATGKQRWQNRGAGRGNCLAWSPDGKRLAVGANGQIRLHNSEDGGNARNLFKSSETIYAVGFNADGDQLISFGSDFQIRRWDTATAKVLREVNVLRETYSTIYSPTRYAFDPDGKQLAIGGDRGMIVVSTEQTGPSRHFGTTSAIHATSALTFTADGRFLLAGHANGSVAVWGLASGRQLRVAMESGHSLSSLAVAPDGRTVVVPSGASVQLWDAAENRLVLGDDAPAFPLHSLAWLQGSKRLVALHDDGSACAWDAATGKCIERLNERCDANAGAAVVGEGKALRLNFNVKGWQDWIPGDSDRRRVGSDAYFRPLSPDGRTAPRLDRNATTLHDIETGKELRPLIDATSLWQPFYFSPGGERIIGFSQDRTLRAWDVATGRPVVTFPPNAPGLGSRLVISPGGRLVAQIFPEMRVWEVSSGKERLNIPLGQRQALSGVFTPDSRGLVVGLRTGEIIAFNLDTGKEYLTRAGHRGTVRAILFSPDGTLLATGSEDTTAMVWDAAPFRVPRTQRDKPEPEAVARWWDELADPDAKKAHTALCTMSDAPAEAIALLRTKLEPVKEDVARRIDKLIADLDARRFPVREKAMRDLTEIGPDILPAVQEALKKDPSPEVKRRLEDLLSQVKVRPQEGRTRVLRALEVLERIGTAEAKEVLKTLADGAPAAWQTREARSILGRLK